jgi:gamma-butyrobetaine dioxygenase
MDREMVRVPTYTRGKGRVAVANATERRGAESILGFPAIWLRDNCPCPKCRDPANGQKLFQINDLPDELAVASVREDKDTIAVTFRPDAHLSVFSRGWLAAQGIVSRGQGRTERDKQLWRACDLKDAIPETEWASYRSDDAERLRSLCEVSSRGFVIVRNAPTKERTVLEVARTFGYVRETNYGELFDVRVETAPSNLAFTGFAIGPHTDNPYRDPVPTMQLLHCLSNAVQGGESGLLDGFLAAAVLRVENPEAFGVLSRTPVPFTWSDAGTVLRAECPLIETDPAGQIRGVRFNNRSMQALQLCEAQLVAFYDAYRAFAGLIEDPETQLTFRLEPGDCVIFDNTRLLHARTAFSDSGSGNRHLQGCYADLDGLFSTIAVLERRL